jgi:hypothetical protein
MDPLNLLVFNRGNGDGVNIEMGRIKGFVVKGKGRRRMKSEMHVCDKFQVNFAMPHITIPWIT